jgi:hypothetical protein
MLTQILLIGAPVLWLTVTVVVIAACRAASNADAARRAPVRVDLRAHRPPRGHRPLQLVRRGADDRAA